MNREPHGSGYASRHKHINRWQRQSPVRVVYLQSIIVDARAIDRLLHLYRTEMHGEHSVSCNGNREWHREKLKSSLILASQYPFVKIE
jgi:hypothetical protein